MLGEGEDLRQGADQDDVRFTALLADMHLDALDHGADEFHGLRAGGVVVKQGLQLHDLLAVQVRHVGVKFDRLFFVVGCQRLLQVSFPDLQRAQFVTNQARIAVAFGDEGQAPFDARADPG